MDRKKTITGAAYQMEACADYMQKIFEADDYQTQQLKFERDGEPGIMVQIRNTSEGFGAWTKKLLGFEACAVIILCHRGTDLLVEVKAGKWLDKIVVNVVSWFFLWPLFITSGIGMWRQKALLDRAFIDTLGFFSGAH